MAAILLKRGRRMYCRVLACDFDGTGAAGGHLAPEVAASLAAARDRGIATLLVTGRVLDDLRLGDVDLDAFAAVVAENGAIVWLPGRRRTIRIGAPPPEHFLGELRAAGVPFHTGAVVVGTWERHAGRLLTLIRRSGVDAQLVFNRDAVMALPSGVNKAVGVERALAELGRSARNMVAFGDAENDLPLLALAELGVAARGAVPAVAAVADERLSRPGPEGVAHWIDGLLARGGVVPTPPRRAVALGHDARGAPATVPASGRHVLVSGDPRSGKSWLAGLVVERLLERGYRVCVLDPEGDHETLGERPGVLVVGNEMPLPPAARLPALLAHTSVVATLAKIDHAGKLAWVDTALAALASARLATGLPQWILVDEAHYFFGEGAARCRFLERPDGCFLLATYRPSLVAWAVHARIGVHVVTHTAVEEERYFVSACLAADGPPSLDVAAALAAIETPRAGLLVQADGDAARWQVFTPDVRLSAHAHHGRKYADRCVPETRAFRFVDANGAAVAVARSLAEFAAAVDTVPEASLRRHLLAGDFSRWAEHVVGDADLAAGLGKLERTARAGVAPSRAEILGHLRDRYLI
jgi:hydroxymethylpyrimidine pyrophosphatase-like HAD family hydrolase